MADSKGSGPTPDDLTRWITTTYPDTKTVAALGATFFSLTDDAWPNFATIVTTDEHDLGTPSNLARDGVYRLNLGVGRETFLRLTGTASDPDYAALDTVIPHPVYAKQRWIAILNPTWQTFDDVVKPLVDEAYRRLAAPRSRTSG